VKRYHIELAAMTVDADWLSLSKPLCDSDKQENLKKAPKLYLIYSDTELKNNNLIYRC